MNDIDEVISDLQNDLEEEYKAIPTLCSEDKLNQTMDNIQTIKERLRILKYAKRILQEENYR